MKIPLNAIFSLILLILVACSQGEKHKNKSQPEEALQLVTIKKERLISAIEAYIKGIKERNFFLIPYAENVTMRTPFTKNGMNLQLKGKEALFNEWWKPLLLTLNPKEVVFKIADYYFDESFTSIIVESVVTDYNAEPPATVYVAERFTLDEAGKIIELNIKTTTNRVDGREP
jgi:hypothetical protein